MAEEAPPKGLLADAAPPKGLLADAALIACTGAGPPQNHYFAIPVRTGVPVQVRLKETLPRHLPCSGR